MYTLKVGDATPRPIIVKEVIRAEPGCVIVMDSDGVERQFYGMPFSLSAYPSNQQELKYGER